jgi:hypothetical protein
LTKRVQILGHDAVTANAFIGLEREVTADIDNNNLRLHDGATPGGHRILNRDENDNRYQARSVELDGLLGWEPNDRGILARQGPSNYDLLTLTVDEDNLTIQFANGFGGNPLFALAPTIESDHTWNGTQTFTQAIVGTGGFAGNLTGNVTGNLTGNVVGNVTGNLTGDANGDHTGTFTGVGTLQDGSSLPDGIVELDDLSDEVNDALNAISTFVGMITMYSGLLANLPDNWNVCDGTNGTPDLRVRFIVCAGPTYAADSTGGAAAHSHGVTIDSGGAHSHTGATGGHSLTTAEMPAHRHANGVTDTGTGDVFSRGTTSSPGSPDSIDNNGSSGTLEGWTETVGSGNPHSHSVTIDSGGSHTHTGSSSSVSSLPPYYSLAFVMRIS